MKTPQNSLCKSQPLQLKKDLQIDKDIFLKVGGRLCSDLSWSSLEAVVLKKDKLFIRKFPSIQYPQIVQILIVPQICNRQKSEVAQ